MKTTVVKLNISQTSHQLAAQQILNWSQSRKSRYVCAANVHMVMEAFDSSKFCEVINRADMVTPDGMPLVWLMRLKGERDQQRVYGPTLMLHVLEAASREKLPVGFYGGEAEVLKMLIEKMQARYGSLNMAFSFSPPFRAMSPEEDTEIVEKINLSGTRILFVGLGCPKQEIWMAEHRGKVNAVMLGVGAAFDFHAGTKSQAPMWMQKTGLEWFFRLITEPRRLWRRYLYHNPRFLFLALLDLLGFLPQQSSN